MSDKVEGPAPPGSAETLAEALETNGSNLLQAAGCSKSCFPTDIADLRVDEEHLQAVQAVHVKWTPSTGPRSAEIKLYSEGAARFVSLSNTALQRSFGKEKAMASPSPAPSHS